MTKRAFLAAAVAALALGSAAGATHWLGVKWHGAPPVTVKVDTSTITDQGLLSVFSIAEANWSVSSVIDMVPGSSGSRLIVATVDTRCPYACTEYKARNGYFSWVKVHVNPALLAYNEATVQAAVCQELGHSLGLDHQFDLSSCMGSTVGSTSSSDVPNQHDYDELLLIYG